MKSHHALYTCLTGSWIFTTSLGERKIWKQLWYCWLCASPLSVEGHGSLSVARVCMCSGVGEFGGWWCVCRLPTEADAMTCCLHLGPNHKLDKNFNSNTCWNCIFSTFCWNSATETSWKIEINEAKRKLMENILLYKEEKLDSMELFGPWWPEQSWELLSSTGYSCTVKEEVFDSLRSVETHTTQKPAWTEGNLFLISVEL